MAWSRPLLLLAALAPLLIAGPGAGRATAHDPPAAAHVLAPAAQGTPLRVVVLPLRLRGEPMPSRRRLERELRRLSAYYARASYGRLRVGGVVAPTYELRRREGAALRFGEPAAAVRAAVRRGVRFRGGIPIFVVPSRGPKTSYASASVGAVIQGVSWRQVSVVAHELGHTLGLDHALAPAACPLPFRPLDCVARARALLEYGDAFDVMGGGGDRFGAVSLTALGVATVQDAPPGRARTTVRPLQDDEPTLLRLRAADRDWYVESRRVAALKYERPVRVPRGVAISRVRPTYAPRVDDLYPAPVRLPATDPSAPCGAGADCLSRQLFRPGRTLTVRGAFRLRVIGGGPRGATRVETAWLDRTPPRLSVAAAGIVRRFGAGDELVLGIRASARGAGVASVEIDQAGTVTRVDPDAVPGLVAGTRGAGRVRAPLVAGAPTASVRLLDAAGNASAAATVDLRSLPRAPAATVTFDPPLGAYKATATQTLGRPVTLTGTTDPALAGRTVRLSAIGGSAPAIVVPIGSGGVFSATWTPPAPGIYRLVARVPVQRAPNRRRVREQTTAGFVRG